MKSRSILFHVVLLAIQAVPSSSQQQSRFQQWNVEDGLSQGSVTSIVQDHEGFMWIGTLDGLNRFDGIEFKTYHHDPNDPFSLGSSSVTCIYEDRDSNLWVGTAGGLNRFDRAQDRFIRYEGAWGGPYYVYRIAEGRYEETKRLWVSAGVLCFLDPALQVLTEHPLDVPPSLVLRSPGIWNLHVEDAMLWLSGQKGFYELDPQSGKVDHVQDGFNHPIESFLFRQQECWVGSPEGLFRYDLQTRRRQLLNTSSTVCLLQDRKGRIWAGTTDGLVQHTLNPDGSIGNVTFRYDEHNEATLSNNNVRALYEDDAGALWVGTYNGLNRLDEYSPQFTVYRHRPHDPNSLGFNFILPIIENRDGEIWFGTFGDGIWVLRNEKHDSQRFVHFTRDSTIKNSLCGDNVRSMLQDRTGVVWIGTDQGVSTYDPRSDRFACYPMKRSDIHESYWVEAMLESRDGTLWLGVHSLGLIRLDRRQWNPEYLHYPDRMDVIQLGDSSRRKPQVINTLAEDRFKNIWVATELGLLKFDPKTGSITQYAHDPDDSTSLSHGTVWSMYEDPSESTHVLWIGTSNGLNRFDTRTGISRRYMKQDGFPNAFVYGILRDDWGRLWLSTNHGLTCFDDRLPHGRKFKNYDVSDGLPGNEFNRRSFCRLQSGEFLFGGTDGVVRFHPLQMSNNPYKPPVVFTSFELFGEPVQFDRELNDVSLIELQPDENVFSFEFAALNFTNPTKNRYAYKMEGFDKNWVSAGVRRYANYTQLDPGMYTFRVKASNNDGVWNEQGASIQVIIHPPYWKTWWFQSLVAVLLLSGGPIIYFRKVGQLKREKLAQQEFSKRLIESQESERKRIARELHDGIGQNLLVMKNNASSIRTHQLPDPEIADRLNDIASAASDALNEIREVTSNLRPFMLDKFGLEEALKSLIERTAQSSEIEFSVDIGNLSGCLPKDQEINFFRVVQESINNILKHSMATRVSISIQRVDKRLVARVEDDGRGFQPEGAAMSPASSGGFGLRSLAERIKILDGTMLIDSAPGRGTRLSFDVPIRQQDS